MPTKAGAGRDPPSCQNTPYWLPASTGHFEKGGKDSLWVPTESLQGLPKQPPEAVRLEVLHLLKRFGASRFGSSFGRSGLLWPKLASSEAEAHIPIPEQGFYHCLLGGKNLWDNNKHFYFGTFAADEVIWTSSH